MHCYWGKKNTSQWVKHRVPRQEAHGANLMRILSSWSAIYHTKDKMRKTKRKSSAQSPSNLAQCVSCSCYYTSRADMCYFRAYWSPRKGMKKRRRWSTSCTSPTSRSGLRGATGTAAPGSPLQGGPRHEIYMFQIKYSFEKISWFTSDTGIQLDIIFLCCVKYQGPPAATDFFTSLTVCQF